MSQAIGHDTNEHIPALILISFPAQTGEIALSPQPETLLHSPLVRLPVDFFNVIRRDGQDVTPVRTARLQNLTTIPGLHPLAEAMYPFTTANLRLPSTLGCHSQLPHFATLWN